MSKTWWDMTQDERLEALREKHSSKRWRDESYGRFRNEASNLAQSAYDEHCAHEQLKGDFGQRIESAQNQTEKKHLQLQLAVITADHDQHVAERAAGVQGVVGDKEQQVRMQQFAAAAEQQRATALTALQAFEKLHKLSDNPAAQLQGQGRGQDEPSAFATPVQEAHAIKALQRNLNATAENTGQASWQSIAAGHERAQANADLLGFDVDEVMRNLDLQPAGSLERRMTDKCISACARNEHRAVPPPNVVKSISETVERATQKQSDADRKRQSTSARL
ncbi:hypothetical protein OPU71_10255 [Niveibacterium sp. 24ML]|uniref:hypothetical protein n=1 Tax=Niveibacterium sp. 24ML TaxID=2985512 RepID=UPI00226FBBAF|nr:hypothetical protein [Niveibacterium sp. 24ML]MCX9156503.1 hypothetical protein [Niveibacterium sp. 24ML]